MRWNEGENKNQENGNFGDINQDRLFVDWKYFILQYVNCSIVCREFVTRIELEISPFNLFRQNTKALSPIEV